jgi:hypothetical protein
MIKLKQFKKSVDYFKSITHAKQAGYAVKEIETNSDKYFNKGFKYTVHINTKSKRILTEVYR